MFGDNQFIIKTADDIPTPARLEQDCFLDTSIEDDCWSDTQLDEVGDGACSTDVPTPLSVLPQTPLESKQFFHRPTSLQTDRLQDYHLLFNPLGMAGVVLANPLTWGLLETYKQPRPLPSEHSPAGRAARRLANLQLIEPVFPSLSPKRAHTTTLTAWLHLTGECNLTCDYCYLSESVAQMDTAIGKQAVDAVFRSAIAHDFKRVKLKYAGGEPTLTFHTLLHLHDYAQQRANDTGLSLKGVVLSNGVGLSDAMITAMQTRGLRLMISLDGVGAYHDVHRPFANGTGSFKLVERTLDRLRDHHLTPSISITVSQRNLAGLPETVAYLLARGLPFTINFYRGSAKTAADTSLDPEEDALITAMQAAFTAIAAHPPSFNLLNALLDRARLDTPHNRPCGAGDSYMVIDANGGVAKCQMNLEQVISTVDIIDPLAAVRADQTGIQNLPVDEKEECSACLWRYRCAGGCPELSQESREFNCRVYQALFPDLLKLEGRRILYYSRER